VSVSLEGYLARLYLDAGARRRFTADPHATATEAGLSAEDVAALERIDGTGLALTARARRPARPGVAARPAGPRAAVAPAPGAALRRQRATHGATAPW
jgi:hypothetical protein